jgi:periplasmic protein TonB
MFGDTLLESSPAARRSKRWPMATAFTAETIVAAILVIVPLLSTGVIPVSARPPIFTPINQVRMEPIERVRTDSSHASGQATPAQPTVVTLNNNRDAIPWGRAIARTTNPNDVTPPNTNIGSGGLPDDLARGPARGNDVRPGRPIISVSSEAQLLNRVEPTYPKMAIVSGVQGQVKLHAIIARDGRIISLNVMSGHPLLVRAAEDAVSQWRYRPYFLNGEAVEVETFITVNFRREGR